jgi:hypothetical protein
MAFIIVAEFLYWHISWNTEFLPLNVVRTAFGYVFSSALMMESLARFRSAICNGMRPFEFLTLAAFGFTNASALMKCLVMFGFSAATCMGVLDLLSLVTAASGVPRILIVSSICLHREDAQAKCSAVALFVSVTVDALAANGDAINIFNMCDGVLNKAQQCKGASCQ